MRRQRLVALAELLLFEFEASFCLARLVERFVIALSEAEQFVCCRCVDLALLLLGCSRENIQVLRPASAAITPQRLVRGC